MVKNTSSETHYLDYDPLGRVVRSKQRTNRVDYLFAGATGTLPGYQWSPGRQLTWMRYPSGREVASVLDDAGRYRSVAKRVIGPADANYFSVTAFPLWSPGERTI